MTENDQMTIDATLERDVGIAVEQALKELARDQQLVLADEAFTSLKDRVVALVLDQIMPIIDNTVGRVVKLEQGMASLLDPGVPRLLSLQEIKMLIEFVSRNFALTTIYSALSEVSAIRGTLKGPRTAPLTELFTELDELVKNCTAVLSQYTPEFLGGLLEEANQAADRSKAIVRALEPYLEQQMGVKVPDTFDLSSVTNTLKELNTQLADIDIKTLDKEIEETWKPIKIGLICVLELIKEICTLLGDVAPLNIRLGAAGGVAAGINVTGKASASVISLGKLSWGTVGSVVNILKTLINTGDQYIDLRIAQRS